MLYTFPLVFMKTLVISFNTLLYHLNENVIAHPTQLSISKYYTHLITVLIVNTSLQKQMHISWKWNIGGHQLWYWSGIKVNILWKCLGSVILLKINVSLQTFRVYSQHIELIQLRNFTNFGKGYPFNKSCLDVIGYRQILDQVCFWSFSNSVIFF